MRARGFHRVTVPVHRENEHAARAVLARHDAVVAPGTASFSGQHFSLSLDLSCVPDGEMGLIELVIRREIEAAR